MGKRSDIMHRPMDNYATPHKAVTPVLPYLREDGIERFAEPCCGAGDLVNHLESEGFTCTSATDIKWGIDALDLGAADFRSADAIITNPPWTLQLLHPLIAHFTSIMPTWLLMAADWPHLVEARGLVPYCSVIVPIGRVKWISKSKFSSKDNVCWYRFEATHGRGPRFMPRQPTLPYKAPVEVFP